jgi:hypothetical protein
MLGTYSPISTKKTETSSDQSLQRSSKRLWELPSARYKTDLEPFGNEELPKALSTVAQITRPLLLDPYGQTINTIGKIRIARHRAVFPDELTSNEETLEYLWCSSILQEIERSKSILDLENDWDGEGSSSYKAATLSRASDFLTDNALQLWEIHHIKLDTPSVSPGPDGSIDIHWKSTARELLINIPEEVGESGTYYGDNKAGQIVKGTLDKSNNLWLLMWLMQ